MKKSSVTALCIILSIVVILAGGLIYVAGLPEYAMLKMAACAVEGDYNSLRPHLTGNAAEKIDPIIDLMENKLLNMILPDDSQPCNWTDKLELRVSDIAKSSSKYTVNIGFKYEDLIDETLAVELIKIDGEWLINDLDISNLPEYTLLRMASYILELDFDGIKPYLTENAAEKINQFIDLTENETVKLISLFFTNSGEVGSIIDRLEWSGLEIMKNSEKCIFSIAVKNEGTADGTISAELIKVDSGWMMNDLNFINISIPW